MYCSKCGSEISSATAFCSQCGQAISGVAMALPSLSPVAPAPPTTVVPAPQTYAYSGGVEYAGFWLRLVAYIIDGIISCVAFVILLIPLFVLTGAGAALARIISDDDVGDDLGAFMGVGFILGFFGIVLVVSWLYNALSESSSWQATPEKDAQPKGDGHERPANYVCACFRTLLQQNNHQHDSSRHRLHHGGLHRKEAGHPRHDRKLPGLAESVARFSHLSLPSPGVTAPFGLRSPFRPSPPRNFLARPERVRG